MQSLRLRRITILVIFSLISNIFVLSIFTQQTSAAVNLTQASMILYRMGVSRTTSVTDPILIIFKPVTVTGAGSQVKISFAAGFSPLAATLVGTTAAVAGTIALPMTVQNQVVQAAPLVNSNSWTVSTTDVNFSTGALVAGSLYGFFITSGVTNPTTTASNPYVSTITTVLSSASLTALDSSRVAVATTTSSGDQVTVTASVPPTFSFSLGSNAIALGDLSTSATVNGNVVATLSTNANNGYVTWVRGNGGGAALNSALASATVNSSIVSLGTPGGGVCTAYSSGNDYYQLTATYTHPAGNGTITKNANYDCGVGFNSGGTIGKYYQEVVRSSGTASGDTVTLYALAAMAALDKAATDYTDTWTVVGAGNF